jgi:Predicted permease
VGLWFLVKFQDYISLILTSLLLTFLFQPIAKLLVKHLKLSWRLSVAIVYVVMVVVLIGLLAWGGISLFGQLQNLIDLLDNKLGDLITTLQAWSGQDLIIGPFSFTIPEITTNYLSDLLVERVQPILGEAGNLIGDVFSGGANLIFRALIMYLVSFFVASESGGTGNKIVNLKLPGYQEDLNRMGKEIFYIWNAFIRGGVYRGGHSHDSFLHFASHIGNALLHWVGNDCRLGTLYSLCGCVGQLDYFRVGGFVCSADSAWVNPGGIHGIGGWLFFGIGQPA